MKIAIGADHGGVETKNRIKELLKSRNIDVNDIGTYSSDSVDYPDVASKVAKLVSEKLVDQGLLVCTTGIGMSITANKFPGVRAALCFNPHFTRMARSHNNANILALPGDHLPEDVLKEMLEAWLDTPFEHGGRHERRVEKINALSQEQRENSQVYEQDPEVHAVLQREDQRQKENLELIASENYTSRVVRETVGSIMTNKYAEGYPGKRWYHGCEFVDEAEQLAIDRLKQLFGAEHANVQAHCGSAANMAVYFAALEPGDTVLAMSLAHGGHLTHGMELNFSGRLFNCAHYGVHQETEQLDYDEILKLAEAARPKMILAGASAYSRIIDFKKLRSIADAVGAYLMVDMAHIAGLVAAGCHPNPVPHCEFVTSTTHKTLRGPRGGLILCQDRFSTDINRQIFPGIQGGPFMHTIAAKAVCFQEALQPEFKTYQQQVVKNAQTLSAELEHHGLRIVSGGTDTHLMLVDLTPIGLTGKDAANLLDGAKITVNKNAIPFDQRSPFVTSGIRIGTPAITTRGMKEREMSQIAESIAKILKCKDDKRVITDQAKKVMDLTSRFPVP